RRPTRPAYRTARTPRPGPAARPQPGRAVVSRQPVRTRDARPVRGGPRAPPAAPPARAPPALAQRLVPDAPRRRPGTHVLRRRTVPVRDGAGHRRLRDPGRAGARRPDRTGALPVLGRRRDHP